MILLQRYAERVPRVRRIEPRAQFQTVTMSGAGPSELSDRDFSPIMGTQTATLVAQESSDSDDRFKCNQGIIPR
jgi:hypothetical protein